jgi:SAM-dependent methyltransferase
MAFPRLRDLLSRRPKAQPVETATTPYTAELLDLLASKFGLERWQFGVDLGPGSGRLAQLFLSHGYTLVAKTMAGQEAPGGELPSLDMDAQWTQLHDAKGSLRTRDLADHSVDFVISERAIYSPDLDAVRSELRRILKPNGTVALITDNRVYGGGTQSEEYEELLRSYCEEFKERAVPMNIQETVERLFAGGDFYQDAFIGNQKLTLEQFIAETEKLSIYPQPGSEAREEMVAALGRFFKKWAVDGVLRVPVVCRVACGRVGGEERTYDAAPMSSLVAQPAH